MCRSLPIYLHMHISYIYNIHTYITVSCIYMYIHGLQPRNTNHRRSFCCGAIGLPKRLRLVKVGGALILAENTSLANLYGYHSVGQKSIKKPGNWNFRCFMIFPNQPTWTRSGGSKQPSIARFALTTCPTKWPGRGPSLWPCGRSGVGFWQWHTVTTCFDVLSGEPWQPQV